MIVFTLKYSVIVDFCLTVVSSETIWTSAGVVIHYINLTASTILTVQYITIINIYFTSLSSEPISTDTVEWIEFNMECSIVLTYLTITGVNVCFTSVSLKTWEAATEVRICCIFTSSTIETGITGTFINGYASYVKITIPSTFAANHFSSHFPKFQEIYVNSSHLLATKTCS